MHTKTIILTFFLALATALPSPAENIEYTTDIIQGSQAKDGTEIDHATAATKNWQAAGGCKRDWGKNRHCLTTCIGEAELGKCVSWKYMTAVLQGGCVPGWNTCRCVCEY